MARLFLPSCALALLSALFLSLSLFHFDLIAFNSSTRITLTRGSLSLWLGSPGDWSAFRFWHNLDIRGWTGSNPTWKPVFSRNTTTWVKATPTVIGAKLISGTTATLPLYLPVIFSAAASAITFFPWRSARRARAGHCRDCGYDLRGIPDQCPECGSLEQRLLARFRRPIPQP